MLWNDLTKSNSKKEYIFNKRNSKKMCYIDVIVLIPLFNYVEQMSESNSEVVKTESIYIE